MDSILKPTLQKFYQTYWPDMDPAYLSQIADKYSVVKVKKGDLILEPGKICNWIGIVNSGALRSYFLGKGKEITTQFFTSNMAVSDYISYVQQSPSRLYISALLDTELIVIEKDQSEVLRLTVPGYVDMVLNYLNMIYIKNFEEHSSIILDSAEVRYQNFLKSRPELIQMVPLYMIASFLGITKEALSRIRQKIAFKKG
jgi:CRP-like cAMP-binding protein